MTRALCLLPLTIAITLAMIVAVCIEHIAGAFAERLERTHHRLCERVRLGFHRRQL